MIFNEISPKLIKIAANSLAEQLTLIFNSFFQEGKFPDKFKVGVIYPTHKYDSKSVCSNYKPILILPLLILEKLMYRKLMDYIIKYKLFY